MSTLELQCKCGKFRATAEIAGPGAGNRLVCHCNSCQAFAAHLGGEITDEFGGTDIYQMAPNDLKITQGRGELRCVRLKEKGLFRWYTGCCNTPVANTVGRNMPFVGLFHASLDPGTDHDTILGPVTGYVSRKSAIAPLPPEREKSAEIWAVLRAIRKVVAWKIGGRGKSTPFFDDNGAAIIAPTKLYDTADA